MPSGGGGVGDMPSGGGGVGRFHVPDMNSAQCKQRGVDDRKLSPPEQQHLRNSTGNGVKASGMRITRIIQSSFSAPARISRKMTALKISAASIRRHHGGRAMAAGRETSSFTEQLL